MQPAPGHFPSALLNCFLFFLVYFSSYGAAALLVRPVYVILRHCDGQLSSHLAAYILSIPFAKVYCRIHWICLLLGFLLLLLRCRLMSFEKIGIRWKQWPHYLRFFVFGAAITAIPLAAAMSGDRWQLRSNFTAGSMALVAAGAISVALAEEIVFRGLLLRLIGGVAGPRFSMALSSLFFAFVHFGKFSMAKFSGSLPTVSDGFRAAWSSISSIFEAFQPIPFLSLLLLGLFLGGLFLNYGNLMACFGFHSGAAFVLIFFRRAIASASASGSAAWLLSSPLCPIVLCVLLPFHFHGNGSAQKTRRQCP